MAKPGYCEACKIYYHNLTEHTKRMHNNGRENKKQIKKKKKVTKPPKEEATKDKYYKDLERELEDLRNENEVLHQHIRELYMILTGKAPPDLNHIAKILGESYDESCRLGLFEELKKVLSERK